MSIDSIPIFTIQLESMKQTLKLALSERSALMSDELQQAVDRYCTEGSLKAVINQTVRQTLDIAVKEEIQTFFRYSGPGRLAIRKAVLDYLDEAYPIKED